MQQTVGIDLWYFDQLHLPVPATVENKQIAGHIAEDEQIAVAEFSLFDCLFYGHGADGQSLMRAEYMRLDDRRLARKRVHSDRCFGLSSRRTGDCRPMPVLLRCGFGGCSFQAGSGRLAWSARFGRWCDFGETLPSSHPIAKTLRLQLGVRQCFAQGRLLAGGFASCCNTVMAALQ